MSSPEVLDQISKLSVKLQDCYANTVIQEQHTAIKGEVCVARCSLDQVTSECPLKNHFMLSLYFACFAFMSLPVKAAN